MAELSALISWLSISGILVGIFTPEVSLFWYYGERSRLNVLLIYGSFLLFSFLIFAVTHQAPALH